MCPSEVNAASWLVRWGWQRKVTWLTGVGSCSWNEHMGGGTTHCLKVVTRTLSAGQSSRKWVTGEEPEPRTLQVASHLRRSPQRRRRRWRPGRGSSQLSSPSHRWRWSRNGWPRGTAGGALGPSTRRLASSGGRRQSPDSVSDTSGSSLPPTAGLWRTSNGEQDQNEDQNQDRDQHRDRILFSVLNTVLRNTRVVWGYVLDELMINDDKFN